MKRQTCWKSSSAHLFLLHFSDCGLFVDRFFTPLYRHLFFFLFFHRVHHLCATYHHFRSLRLCSTELSRQVQKKWLKEKKRKQAETLIRFTRDISATYLPVSETRIQNKYAFLLTNKIPTNKMEESGLLLHVGTYRPIFNTASCQNGAVCSIRDI